MLWMWKQMNTRCYECESKWILDAMNVKANEY
jgi:hypothetical protein